jgi:hypothetical protein
MADDNKYADLFKDEMVDLQDQAKETDKLYDETHQAMEKNLDRMNSKTMFGSTSPYRDISELSKSLTGIRQTRVSITRERINLKKSQAELEIKNKQTDNDSKNATTNEFIMRDYMSKFIGSSQQNGNQDNTGIDKLSKLTEKDVGLNENEINMISNFKGTKK